MRDALKPRPHRGQVRNRFSSPSRRQSRWPGVASLVEPLESRLHLAADPTLAAWFKADSIALPSGAAVSSWIDSTGNGFHASQANGLQRPHLLAQSFNGHSAVHFDSINGTQLSFPRPVSGDF